MHLGLPLHSRQRHNLLARDRQHRHWNYDRFVHHSILSFGCIAAQLAARELNDWWSLSRIELTLAADSVT